MSPAELFKISCFCYLCMKHKLCLFGQGIEFYITPDAVIIVCVANICSVVKYNVNVVYLLSVSTNKCAGWAHCQLAPDQHSEGINIKCPPPRPLDNLSVGHWGWPKRREDSRCQDHLHGSYGSGGGCFLAPAPWIPVWLCCRWPETNDVRQHGQQNLISLKLLNVFLCLPNEWL